MRWALVSTLLAACGGSHDCEISPMRSTVYIVNGITLPQRSTDFAFDLNGDGHDDNRMGNILGALIQNGWDPQGVADSALRNGSFRPNIELLEGADASAHLVAVVADQDPTQPRAFFCMDSVYDGWRSPDALNLDKAFTLAMHLPFLDDNLISAVAVHLSLQRSGDAVTGQLNVGIRMDQFDPVVIPALAKVLTQRISGASTGVDGGASTDQITSLFDTGGADDGSGCVLMMTCAWIGQPVGTAACRNPSYGERPGQCADQCDGIIDSCEVSTNQLVKNLLAPDVQLFAPNGSWKPSPANKLKDSLSFGFAFTAAVEQ